MRDHERRSNLRAVGFGGNRLAPESNVQNRSVRRRVWNSPIEKRDPRIHRRCNSDRVRPAAIQRQPKLQFTIRRPLDRARNRCLPLDPDVVSRIENLPSLRRNQRERRGRRRRRRGEHPGREGKSQHEHCYNESCHGFHFSLLGLITKVPGKNHSASSDFTITFLSSASPKRGAPRQRLFLSNRERQFDGCAATNLAFDRCRAAVKIDN
jgi:hypothetical protein